MLETILLDAVVAMVIISPVVILIGLVISIGNERQRKELARIRTIADQWAVEDLRMKRAKLAREISITDPKEWCNDLVARVLQWNPESGVEAALTKPDALVMYSSKQGRVLAISPVSPEVAQQFTKRATKMDQQTASLSASNPLFPYPRNANVTELSPLNAGVMFDLEIEEVWKQLTKAKAAPPSPIWYLYDIPSKTGKARA
jgi:hypothetical protein